ncbi:uncharacterized protein LOC133178491 [Saccostrea echinata]|uniref:uncharacterized protein LOC133178491 n=1 Tax=Saccostrea echinata TaxID=191078 RepID=UPI002A7EDF49|nr:uncharacterized protein LOC133178491 [Saccostrea echinata]
MGRQTFQQVGKAFCCTENDFLLSVIGMTMAHIHFYICLLIPFSSINVYTVLSNSQECYKVDGNKDGILPGTYVGIVHLQNEKIGSIWFSNDTGSKCICRFSNNHFIQNVTYYGMHIPDIQSLFDTGCHIVKNNKVEKIGYNCALNITEKKHINDVNCTNTAIASSPLSTTFIIPTDRLETRPLSTFTTISPMISASEAIPSSGSGSPEQSSGSTGHSTESVVSTVRGTTTVTHKPGTKSHVSSLTLLTIASVSLTAVTTNPTKHGSPYGLTSEKVSPSPENVNPSAGLTTDQRLEITTINKTETSSGLTLEIIIPLVLAVVLLSFIILILVCIRKQREKKRIFKYEVSPTPSLRLQESNSDKEEILKYNNEFHEYGTKHNILYEGDDYCEHGIFNKAFIETHPGASKKKDERVYAPTLERHPEELVLEEEEPGTSTQYVLSNDKENIVPTE